MSKKDLENYRIVSMVSPDGRKLIRTREYIGPRYTLMLDAQTQRRLTVAFIAAAIGALAVHIVSALWNIPSNASGAVGAPALLALVPLLLTAFGALNGLTVRNGVGMEKGKYRATAEFRRYGALCAGAVLAYCTAACLVYTVVRRETVPVGKELVMSGAYLLELVACLWIWRTERKLTYDTTPGENTKA